MEPVGNNLPDWAEQATRLVETDRNAHIPATW